MAKYSTSWYILALGVLNLISKTNLTAQDHGHGYITSSERYFDDFSFIQRELSSGLRFDYVGNNLKLQIKFDPVSLDFGQRPLGIPHMKKVHIFNYDSNKSIDMTSISGTTVDFHSSFFNDKRIPPMGNTSFHVVFLGREEGFRESCLFIHTTIGHFKYNVKGVSIYSPYFLRPIVGIKLPMNASFGPLIYLHNPHTDPIQILEVYTSGGDFHLELPSGDRESPKKIWEIAPFETKAVIRVKFTAKVEQNHTAFVRIKLNITEEVLVVPLEIEVGQRGGIFSPQGYVDFGIGGSMDEPKTIKLCLYNPFTKPVKIQSITVKSNAVNVEYLPSVIIPTGKFGGSCADIADLTVDWKTANEHQDFTGKIVVKYRNGRSISEIPYYLTALEGSLVFDSQATKFFTNDKSKNTIRHFKIKNEFKSAIKILNITMAEEVRKYFKIHNFKALTLESQEEAIIFSSELKPGVELESLHLDSHIQLVSNISIVTIPFMSFGGTLKLYLPFKSRDYSLDVGLISFNTTKEVNFLVLNDNPVNIHLKAIKTSIPLTSTTIVGCGKDNAKSALFQSSFHNLHACNKLKPNEYAILKLLVQTANNEGHVWGEIQIETDFESLSIPVQFRVAAGKLEIGPDRLVFDQCFPGKICSHPLKVYSTFNEPMIIKDIISLPPDPRLHSRHTGHISPHATKIVGHLYLNPNIGCGNECYTGLHQDLYNQWLKTLMLPKSVVNFDLNLFNTHYNRFLNITWNGMDKWQNLTLRLDTSEVRSHMFKTRVEMTWPSLIHGNQDSKSIISFPLTQIGNITYINITIKNPSSKALMVQILLDGVYPNIELLYEGLPSASLPQYFFSESGNFFLVKNGLSSESIVEKMGIKVHSSTLPLILKPRENYTLTIGFLGEKAGEFATFLFLRNNLTVMEILRLKGRSTEPIFSLGNRRSGASQPLLFEFTDKHSKECERDKSVLFTNRNLVIKRSFTAKNIGEIPISITNFFINDAACEGYGFKVLNCKSVFLLANVTRKIDIEFTPDFTMTKVVRSLVIESSCNSNINYTLQAIIPSCFISICSNIVPRPYWEWYVCYIAAILMSLMMFPILFIAICDAEKTKNQMIDIIIASRPTVQPTLDLRSIGQQVKEEIKTTKVESTNDFGKTDIKVSHSEISKSESEFELKEKKRLAKRNSNDYTEYTEASKKIVECTKQINVIADEKDKDEEKRSSHNKEYKKVASRNTKTNKWPVEEQALLESSKSSSIFDDVLEVQDASQKYSKSNLKRENKLDSISNQTTLEENHRGQIPLENRIEKKRSLKDTPRGKDQIDNSKNSNRNEGSKRGGKEQRDRNTPSKKTIEKFVKRSPEHKFPVSSVMSSTTRSWTENKATFSDVVARNDSLSNIGNVTNQLSSYIDTSNHITTTLGPIGSRPVTDYWSNGRNTQSQVFKEPQNGTINSFSIGIDQEYQNNTMNISNEIQSWNSPMESYQEHQYNQFWSNTSNSSLQDFGRLCNHYYMNSNTHWDHSNGPRLLGVPSAVGDSSLLSSNPARPNYRQYDSSLDTTASIPNYRQQNPAASTTSTSSLWHQWMLPFNLTTRTPPGFQSTHRNTEGPNENPNPTNGFSTFSNNIWKYSNDS